MDDFEVIEQIGKGSFGIVQKIQRKSDGRFFVWKVINYAKMGTREKQQLIAEVNILRELKHVNIVRFYDRIIDQKQCKIYVIMEYCAGGDMSALLKQCKRENDFIGEYTIWKMFGQIMFALNECHTRSSGKILHRDLKPANIFFDAQKNVKLGDFGLSRVMGENSVFATTNVGTPFYMSPEQIGESKYDEKSDIWSAGCLLYEMAALKPPFQAQNHLQLAIKIKDGRFERIPQRYSEDLQSLIEAMLHSDPSKRPSVQQIIELPLIALPHKERKQREKAAEFKVKEEENAKKLAVLAVRETALDQRDTLIAVLEEAQRQMAAECALMEAKLKGMSSASHKSRHESAVIGAEVLTTETSSSQCFVKEGTLNSSCAKSTPSVASTNNTFEIRKDASNTLPLSSLANSQPKRESSFEQQFEPIDAVAQQPQQPVRLRSDRSRTNLSSQRVNGVEPIQLFPKNNNNHHHHQSNVMNYSSVQEEFQKQTSPHHFRSVNMNSNTTTMNHQMQHNASTSIEENHTSSSTVNSTTQKVTTIPSLPSSASSTLLRNQSSCAVDSSEKVNNNNNNNYILSPRSKQVNPVTQSRSNEYIQKPRPTSSTGLSSQPSQKQQLTEPSKEIVPQKNAPKESSQPILSRPRAVNSIDSTSYHNNNSNNTIESRMTYLNYLRSQATTSQSSQNPPLTSHVKSNSIGRYATSPATDSAATRAIVPKKSTPSIGPATAPSPPPIAPAATTTAQNQTKAGVSQQLPQKLQLQMQRPFIDYTHSRQSHNRANSSNAATSITTAPSAQDQQQKTTPIAPRKKSTLTPPTSNTAITYLTTNSSYQSSAVPPLPHSRVHSTTLLERPQLRKDNNQSVVQQQSSSTTRPRLIPPSIAETTTMLQRTLSNEKTASQQVDTNYHRYADIPKKAALNIPLANVPSQQQVVSSSQQQSQQQQQTQVRSLTPQQLQQLVEQKRH